jgi:hypothetical protein
MPYLYNLHGLIVGSEFEFPELELRRRHAGEPNLHVAMGEAKPAPITTDRMPFLELENGQEPRNGHASLMVPGVARYRVCDGRAVLVEPDPNADPALVRLFILGSVMAIVCHQRGLIPLHASAIEYAGEAIAFVGHPGDGKSTLAAHCLAHGPVRLIADDLVAVFFDQSGRPWVNPGMPSVKLWRDTLEALGRSSEGLQRDWFRADKFHLPICVQRSERPLPLSRIYVLAEDDDAGPGRIEPIKGAAAAAALIVHTSGIEKLVGMSDRPGHFAMTAQLAAKISVRLLARRRDLAHVATTAAAVLTDLQPASEAAP